MQGRHIRIKPDDYEELDIEEGITGCKRHDLIVVTYEKNEVTSVETAKLEVLTGIPVADGSVSVTNQEVVSQESTNTVG